MRMWSKRTGLGPVNPGYGDWEDPEIGGADQRVYIARMGALAEFLSAVLKLKGEVAPRQSLAQAL